MRHKCVVLRLAMKLLFKNNCKGNRFLIKVSLVLSYFCMIQVFLEDCTRNTRWLCVHIRHKGLHGYISSTPQVLIWLSTPWVPSHWIFIQDPSLHIYIIHVDICVCTGTFDLSACYYHIIMLNIKCDYRSIHIPHLLSGLEQSSDSSAAEQETTLAKKSNAINIL